MRVYFEYRNSTNDKAIPPALLDMIVARFFGVELDSDKYIIPPNNRVSWLDMFEGLLWTAKLECANGSTDRVLMDELISAIDNNSSMHVINDKRSYIDLLCLFKEMNIYLYVEYLHESMFTPRNTNAPHMTIDIEKIYTKEEVNQLAEKTPNWECMRKLYEYKNFI